MTTILDRLSILAIPGLPDAAAYKGFISYCGGRLMPLNAKDDQIVWTDPAAFRTWGKHLGLLEITIDCNEDGADGLALQRRAILLYTFPNKDGWYELAERINKLERLQLRQFIGKDTINVGGWPQWYSPVRAELKFIEDTLRNHVSYDDQSAMENVTGLALAILAYQKHPNRTCADTQTMRCIAMIENAVKRALADAERNGGLGNIHNTRTHAILDQRAHEPPLVSTDATASLVYMLLVAWAVTGLEMYRQHARDWADRLEWMRRPAGFFPFVQFLDGNYYPGGYSIDYRLARPSLAFTGNYDKVTGEPIIGLKPTPAVQKILDRSRKALQ